MHKMSIIKCSCPNMKRNDTVKQVFSSYNMSLLSRISSYILQVPLVKMEFSWYFQEFDAVKWLENTSKPTCILTNVSKFFQTITQTYNCVRMKLSSTIDGHDIDQIHPLVFQLVRILCLATRTVHTKHVGLELYQHLYNIFLLHFDINTFPRLYAVLLHQYIVHLDFSEASKGYAYLRQSVKYCLMRENIDTKTNVVELDSYVYSKQLQFIDKWLFNDHPPIVSATASFILHKEHEPDINSMNKGGIESINTYNILRDRLKRDHEFQNFCLQQILERETYVSMYRRSHNKYNMNAMIVFFIDFLSFTIHLDKTIDTADIRSIVNSFGYFLTSLRISSKNVNNKQFNGYFDIRHEMLAWTFIGRFYLYREQSFCPKLADLAFNYAIKCGNVTTIENMEKHLNEIEKKSKLLHWIDSHSYDNIDRTIDACDELIQLYEITLNTKQMGKISTLKYNLLCEKSKRNKQFKIGYSKEIDECKTRLASLCKLHRMVTARGIRVPTADDTCINYTKNGCPKSVSLKSRWKEEMSVILDEQYPYATELQYGQTLSINNNLQILKNMVSMKQCNWKYCMKKSCKLRRCKKCKSVYYCSKLCQKKDWNLNVDKTSHKLRCRAAKTRILSLTLEL